MRSIFKPYRMAKKSFLIWNRKIDRKLLLLLFICFYELQLECAHFFLNELIHENRMERYSN